VFNRKNVFLYTPDTIGYEAVIRGVSQLPLLPSFGLRMDW